MELPAYIERIGDEAAARMFGVTERCVLSWRLRDRMPRPKKAREIVAKTGGDVTLAEIYAPPNGDGA